MGFLQKINVVWQKVGIVQRGLLAAIVMACVITGVLLTKWAANADMQLLYNNLSADSAGAIVDKIAEANVEYQLRSGGSSIYVPSGQVYKLRLAMAKDGLPETSKSGYGIFDDEKIGVSPLVQQLNKNRAIQDELAKTIQMIDGVVSARIHITRPEETMFGGGSQEATAAVVLAVRPGWSIGASSVAAITHIVAGAVEGLSADNVTIADSTGLLTSKGGGNSSVGVANTFMDYKERVEQTISGNLTEMLDKVLGPGRVSVKVSATVDMTNETVQTTLYEKGMPEEEIIDSGSTVLPGTMDSEGNEVSAGSTEKSETITNKFKVPMTVTTKTDVPGKIVSLSVAAFVDLSIVTPVVIPEGEEPPATPPEPEITKIMSVEDVTEIIRNAVGPELLKDESSLTVKDIMFSRPLIALADDSGGYEKLSRYIEIARQSSMGLLAVCALLVLKIFSGAKNKASGDIAAADGLAEAGGVGMLGAGGGGGGGGQLALRQQIAGQLQENPEQVRQLFANWLAEEK